MKIYIDGLFYKGSGIGRYYASLIKELAQKGFTIYTAVPKKFKSDFENEFNNYQNIKEIYVNYEKFSIKGFFLHSSILDKIKNEVSLFHFPHINLPKKIPAMDKTVVTIHDLIPLKFFSGDKIVKRLLYKFLLLRSINNSKGLIMISNYVKEDFINRFGNPKDKKIVTIYNFIEDKFYTSPNTERIVNKPYILFVGNRKRHKNIEALIKAFRTIKRLDYLLVIAGSKSDNEESIKDIVRNLGLNDRIIEFFSPDDNTLINLYSYADLFVFPSLHEGFGYPTIESIVRGCPVVLSDIPVFREILGESGVYFDPLKPEDISEKITKMLIDRNYRNEVLRKQRERIKIFNKEKSINEYISFFESFII